MIDPISSLSSLQSISSNASNLFADQSGMPSTDPNATTPSFSDTLANAFSRANDAINNSTAMSTAFATGQTSDVHGVMIASEKAGVALDMVAEVRNKVVEAYQEVMRIAM